MYAVRKEVIIKGKKTTKTTYVRNRDKRDKFISQFGKKKFDEISKNDGEWNRLRELELPKRFNWIWLQFLQVWGTCGHDFSGNVIFTTRTILDYCECFKVTFSVYERKLLFRMHAWAREEISNLEKKED